MTDKKSPIVFFDSGVGGLAVLYEMLQDRPNDYYVFYADSANVPYGNKSLNEIKRLVMDATEQIAKLSPQALVLACNTATSAAAQELRSIYDFPIVGMEPAVKPALTRFDARKVMVFATERTLQENKYTSLVSSLGAEERVDCRAMMDLVMYAENYDFQSANLRKYLRDKLADIDWSMYHTLVLGCTHFLYFRAILHELLPNHVIITDGNRGTINRLKSLINTPDPDQQQLIEILLSGKEVDAELVQPYFAILDKLKSSN